MNVLPSEKTYRCGWCGANGVIMRGDGQLDSHTQKGTTSTECRGIETYHMRGRAK